MEGTVFLKTKGSFLQIGDLRDNCERAPVRHKSISMKQEPSKSQRSSAEEINKDVMAARPLHKIMVLLNAPEGWSVSKTGLGLLFMATLSGVVWWGLSANIFLALLVGGLLLLFFLGDYLILSALPRMRISFGPWRAQIFPLEIPRFLAMITLGFIALFTGWIWGIVFVLVVQAVGTTALLWGAMVEPSRLQKTFLDITTDRLEYDTLPIRLLHISDLHIERLTRREDSILSFIVTTQPDIIVLTGDYVNLSYNRDPETYRQTRAFLGQLSAPYGVYATLGTPTVDLRELVVPMFEGLPVTLLRENCHTVTLGEGRQLVLLGLDCTHHVTADAICLERLVRLAPTDAPQIFLYHSPELMPQAAEHGIDLYLCGHTHGGQVRLPFVGPLLTSSQLGRQYVMGLYRRNRTHLYVSRGVGLEGLSAPRVRLLAPPEITLVTLRPG